MKLLLGFYLCVHGLQVYSQNVLAKVELEAANVKKVSVQGAFVDIYVAKGERIYLHGIIEGSGEEGDYRIHTSIENEALVVEIETMKNDLHWKSRRITKARIDITILEGVELDIDNSSGDVRVENLQSSKSNIKASSGDIVLRKIVSNLQVETSSGDIALQGLVGDSQIESTSGDQHLMEIQGTVKTQASSGDIRIDTFEGELAVKSTSGDVEIVDGVGTVNVRSTSGEIEGRNIELTGDANFNATSGDIEVDFENELDNLSFDLSASSGELEVGGKSANKRLILERGGYVVKGVTSSGSQEYD